MKLPNQCSAAGQTDGQCGEGLAAASEDAENGIDDIVDQRSGDGAERAADDDADGQIQHVAPGDEGSELAEETARFIVACHSGPPLCKTEMKQK